MVQRLWCGNRLLQTYNREKFFAGWMSARGQSTKILPPGRAVGDIRVYDVDALGCLATGFFECDDGALRGSIFAGWGSVPCRDLWEDGPLRLSGVGHCEKFPNMFIITGPGSPVPCSPT